MPHISGITITTGYLPEADRHLAVGRRQPIGGGRDDLTRHSFRGGRKTGNSRPRRSHLRQKLAPGHAFVRIGNPVLFQVHEHLLYMGGLNRPFRKSRDLAC
jgi:hypothetical protein